MATYKDSRDDSNDEEVACPGLLHPTPGAALHVALHVARNVHAFSRIPDNIAPRHRCRLLLR